MPLVWVWQLQSNQSIAKGIIFPNLNEKHCTLKVKKVRSQVKCWPIQTHSSKIGKFHPHLVDSKCTTCSKRELLFLFFMYVVHLESTRWGCDFLNLLLCIWTYPWVNKLGQVILFIFVFYFRITNWVIMGIEDDDLIEGSPPTAPQGLEVSDIQVRILQY